MQYDNDDQVNRPAAESPVRTVEQLLSDLRNRKPTRILFESPDTIGHVRRLFPEKQPSVAVNWFHTVLMLIHRECPVGVEVFSASPSSSRTSRSWRSRPGRPS